MGTLTIILVCVFIVGCAAKDLEFPSGFKFGAATAAYQVEGGWNASDKTPSIWDEFSQKKPEMIKDGSNGNVACDSYNLWREDVKLAVDMGLHFYRFSISWPRLLPNGVANKVSEDGVRYYNSLIDELIANGIEPMVTLHHWDLPVVFDRMGGWTNPLIADWFAEYARVAYSLFGDRVKTWLTINEPIVICSFGYGSTIFPPQLDDPHFAMYLCNKHVLLAHAKAWRVYDREFRSKQHGRVAICNHYLWIETQNPDEEEDIELAREYSYGLYTHPIYAKKGGWPPRVEKLIAEKSKREGHPISRLPAFTKEEIELVRGTYDYLGLNHYTSRMARKSKEDKLRPWPFFGSEELDVMFEIAPEWTATTSFWFAVYPEGLRKCLVWLKKHYGDIEIVITENGYSSGGNEINDIQRVNYYKDYLEQVLLAIKEDDVNITGYTAWTLIDNYEWMDGYMSKFGLYEVDFNDPGRKRRPRLSARYYAAIIKAHSLNVPVPHDEL